MFGRNKKSVAAAEASEQGEATTVEETSAATDRPQDVSESAHGPQDFADVSDTSTRFDLGSILLTPSPETDLRLEVDEKSGDVTAVQIANDHGAVQLQVFAAPRTAGIWDDIRGEISEMITGNGGTVEETTGPFGVELRTRLAQPGPQGRTVFAPAVFAGTDGPRWFLRAVYSGTAAVDDSARAVFDDVLRTVVVARGDEPRAPREMLPLQMPSGLDDTAPEQGTQDEDAPSDDLKPFERGPEITEVR